MLVGDELRQVQCERDNHLRNGRVRFRSAAEHADQRAQTIAPLRVEAQFAGVSLQRVVAVEDAGEVDEAEIGVAGGLAGAVVIGEDRRHLRAAADVEHAARIDAPVLVLSNAVYVELSVLNVVGRTSRARIGRLRAGDAIPVGIECDVSVLRRIPGERRVDGLVFHWARVAAGERVSRETVARVVARRQTPAQRAFDDRAGDAARDRVIIVRIGIRSREAAAEIIRGRAGDDADGAAQRVVAEERALRPAQHFDARHVHDGIVQVRGVHLIDAVNENADARLHAIDQSRADAANRHECAPNRIRCDVEARRQCSDFAHRIDLLTLQRVGVDGRDCHRHVLQTFFALARCDDDLFILGSVSAGVLGHRDAGRRNHCEGRAGQKLVNAPHVSTPLWPVLSLVY